MRCCSRAESLKSRDDELNCSHNVRSNKKFINKSIIFNCKNINCVNVDLCVLVQLLFMLITRSRQNNIWFSESSRQSCPIWCVFFLNHSYGCFPSFHQFVDIRVINTIRGIQLSNSNVILTVTCVTSC